MRRQICIALAVIGLISCKSREEKLKAAEEKSRLMVDTKARMAKGIGESLKTEGKAGAEALSQGVGEVLKGAGKGFDESLSRVTVHVDQALASKGVQATRASQKKHVVAVYVIWNQAYSGPLTLRALDSKQFEVGRSTADAKEPAGSAKYVEFTFDPHTPMAAVASFDLK